MVTPVASSRDNAFFHDPHRHRYGQGLRVPCPPRSRVVAYALRHFAMVVVFFGGIMVGVTLSNGTIVDSSAHSTGLLRQDLTAQEPGYRPLLEPTLAVRDHREGWKTMEVFYGSADSDESLSPGHKTFFSQARQDEAILSMLRNKTNGFFVDLAANDATMLSNTYALEKHFGWTGLCIEPNPKYWYNLTHTRENCQIIGAVVGRSRMEPVHFNFDGLDHGGIAGNGFDNGPRFKRSSTKAYTVTLLEIFQKFRVPKVIDYLSLDVEGAEEFIMSGFPLKEYQIRILTIERPKENLRTYLESHGYKQVLRLSRWGETLWIHGAFEKSMDLTNIQDFHGKKQYAEQKARQQQQQQQLSS
ncbi:unnamed protein product [Pseudo-nitzschia multistriata]|uniref:Methyltransferase FkbM domain-containing protein n=1 Tax=Pseudo-nitzschia multistriata TaxID=183589 RepID=A0A448Z6B4_9STRA|nr:unnamed protein product [Pseudo-nitzschia multistriata]